MDRQNKGTREYPLRCPVCRTAMVGEKSSPEAADYDRHRCFNCGATVDFSSPPDDDEAE
jgi:hypothetical protein